MTNFSIKPALSLKDFLFKEKASALKKLKTLLNHGKDKLHLVLDFDRTLTKSENELGENVSVWEFLRSHLPSEDQLEYERFYDKYRSLETKKLMTTKDAIAWWEGILSLFQKNKLNWLDVTKDVEKRMPIRPYTEGLFQVCQRKNIPTIIISAGIKDVIELLCQKWEIGPTIILSTNLIFSSEGCIIGWERDSLVHVLNKREKGHPEIEKIKTKRPNTILIGDGLDDVNMVGGKENVLRVAVYDPRKDDKIEELQEFIEKFDLVITSGTLQPLIKILNLF